MGCYAGEVGVLKIKSPTIAVIFVFLSDERSAIKKTGPEIFIQSHSLILPSGTLDDLPSNEMLSVGKVITWSGPATAIGGLFFQCILHMRFLLFQLQLIFHQFIIHTFLIS